MKSILKKFFIISLIFMLLDTLVFANDSFYPEAYKSAASYIDKSIKLGQSEWENFLISNYHELYDNQLNVYGYIFELSSDNKPGYIIVTCEKNSCSVIEASYDSPSPYKNYDGSYKYVYSNILEYIVAKPTSKIGLGIVFQNTETKEVVSINQTKRLRVVDINKNQYLYKSAPSYETVKYVDNYTTHFKSINQNTSYNCVATSMAMCLNYLSNKGRIAFHDMDAGNTIVEQVRNTITGYYNPKVGSDSVVRAAINAFGTNNCYPVISTKGDGFWGNNPVTDISFNTIITEINDNCPMVMMFNPGVFSGITVNHATACYGYKRINNSSTPTDYTIVKVPQNSSESSVMTKEIQWSYANVHGYYLVYVW